MTTEGQLYLFLISCVRKKIPLIHCSYERFSLSLPKQLSPIPLTAENTAHIGNVNHICYCTHICLATSKAQKYMTFKGIKKTSYHATPECRTGCTDKDFVKTWFLYISQNNKLSLHCSFNATI